MYPQMVYHADVRAREKELAARERDMGGSSCAPLGRIISRFIINCNGRREGRVRYDERMGMDYGAMAYAPAQTCYVRPTAARTVTLAAATNHHHHPTNAHADHPDAQPPRAHATTTTTLPPSFAPAGAPAQRTGGGGGGMPARKPKKKKKKQVRFTPSSGAAQVPAAGAPPHDTASMAASGGGSAAGSAYHHHATPAADPTSYSAATPPAHGGHHHGSYAYGYGRYAPSPLPRWEMLGTPRRHEYFSSEYRWYYPTPVREGIYSIATDANGRLTTIFSEENPNACTIV